MKKLFVYAGIACAAALSLTNCSKIEPQTPSSEGMPFEIVASTAETKTANDGLKTTWVEGDALNLFHAETGSTTDYGTNDEFTFVSRENFSGTLTEPLDASKNYDWYALYPYNKNIKTPAATESGYIYIGDSRGVSQNGYDNTEHLSDNRCPLYGVVKGVAANEPVKVNMHHLASVVKIVVTNKNDDPLTVNTVTLTAGEDIVGSYFIDFTGATVKYTERAADKVYKTATLNVSNGTALAKGGSAAFYIPIKPFTAVKGSELKITVNGQEKVKALDADKTFVAGTIHQIGFSYDKAETPVSGKTVTKSIEELFNGKEDATQITSIALDDNITLSVSEGNYTGKYYTSDKTWRLYQNESATLTISAKAGCTLKSTTLTFKTEKSGTLNYGSTSVSSGSAVTLSGNSAKFTVSGTGTKGQIRITNISVTYE